VSGKPLVRKIVLVNEGPIIRGVGRGIGRELARLGARVFITGRSMPDLARLDDRITGIPCDHSVDTQVEAAFNLILS
jgi:NAD(P)-dependent dehydrogenase (short-subunit alcohol dehydrogenase family)